ncbi:MAG: hypothetical protein KKA84_12285 [Bacteroidetes bacterium]|nr:hypothetical protein [Bacteroidota bacterium]
MKNIFILSSMVLFVFSTIIFFESCDINSPIDIEQIEISADSLDFGLFRDEMEFIIVNTDTLNIYWSAQPAHDWIEVEPASGLLESDVPDTIKIRVDRTQLRYGRYEGDVILEFDTTIETILINVSLLMQSIAEIPTTPIVFSPSDSVVTFSITNSGNFPLDWSLQPVDRWITVVPSSGTILPDTTNSSKLLKSVEVSTEVKIFVDRTSLQPGHHESSIILQTSNGVDTIHVAIDISTNPLFEINTASLTFGLEETQKKIIIWNYGGGTVDWSASTTVNWISVTPASGLLTTEPGSKLSKNSKVNNIASRIDSILVEVDRDGLLPGTHTGAIEFTTNAGNKSVIVSMRIDANPILHVNTTHLEFGEIETEGSLQIINTGTGTVDWLASSNRTWIDAYPASGSVSTGQSNLNISVNRTGLNPGPYAGTVSITSNGGDQNIQVSMTVPEPVLELPILSYTPSSFDFGTNDSLRTLSIANIGMATLNWQITNNDAWVDISPASGSTTVENDQVSISISRQGLAPGDYSSQILISSDGGSGTVSISMKVDDPKPVLFYAPNTFSFTNSDSAGIVQISNTGAGTLNWQLISSETWITLSKDAGSNTVGTTDINVICHPSMLLPGEHSGKVEIQSDGGNGEIEINILIPQLQPELDYRPGNLEFREDGDSLQTVTIFNKGEGILNWQLSPTENWILLSKTSGSSENDSSKIQVTVAHQGMLPGEYRGTIDITSDGGTGSIDVLMVIPEKPILLVTNHLLNFGFETSSLQFEIKNNGTGKLTWYCDEAYDWFSVSPATGETTTESDIITVRVDRNNLSGGQYTGIITVASDGGEDQVEVKMEVQEIPILEVSQSVVSLSNTTTQKSLKVKNVGEGVLHWNSSIEYGTDNTTNSPWLFISPGGGSTTSEDEVFFNANSAGLPANNYTAKVTIESDGGTAYVEVYFLVEHPTLNLSTHFIDFGETDTHNTFQITNGGSGELVWNLSSTAGWLSAYPTSGTTTTGTEIINVNVTREFKNDMRTLHKVKGGVYTGAILISAQETTDRVNVDTVHVKMTIANPPVIQTDPTSMMYFGSDFNTLALDIKNVGEGTLEWWLIVDNTDIHIDAANGTCVSGEKKTVNVTPNRSMSPGSYYGNITVQSNGGSDIYISVQWTVL